MLRRKILRKLRKKIKMIKKNKTDKYEKDLIKHKFKLLNIYYNKYALK